MGRNVELQERYAANRLRVIRQMHYSRNHQNCIDLVLFLNGLPVATVEIKTDYTQSIEDAVYQYQTDRQPRDAQRRVEPLLHFPGGALVHFALSNSEVRMCTQLKGLDSRFLPFNQGSNGPGVSGGAGKSPQSPRDCYQLSLAGDLAARFLAGDPQSLRDPRPGPQTTPPNRHLPPFSSARRHPQALGRHSPTRPRQTLPDPALRRLRQDPLHCLDRHLLADLHNEQEEKVFDSIIVISDRTVLDDHLQEALAAHERHRVVVAYITGNQGSKSQELQDALDLSRIGNMAPLQDRHKGASPGSP